MESPFFEGGVRVPSHRGQSGTDQHNWQFSFELADPSLYQHGTPPAGDYPVTIKAGDHVVGSFILEWR
jgi:hypothetical protein